MDDRTLTARQAILSTITAAVAAIGALTAGAMACGPTRNKHVTTIEIEAAASKVWGIVGNYGDFGWTGRIARTEASGGLVPDIARRKLVFRSGAQFADQLSVYDAEQMTIAFMTDVEDVREMPVHNYASRITVRDEGGHSLVEWRGAFVRGYPNNDPPSELSDGAALKAVSEFQQAALEALKRRVEGNH